MINQQLKSSTSTSDLIAGGHVGNLKNPFALPTGLKGRLAGWYMGLSDAQHRELARDVSLIDRTVLVEIGCGPGQFLEMVHKRAPGLAMAAVDPSGLMVKRARRRIPQGDLQLGAAAAIPLPDGYADIIVSINNIPMWPDLDAGLVEIRRVLRPGGSLIIAWHGGHDPRGHQHRLVLSPKRKSAIDAAIRRWFPEVRARTLQHSDVWEV